MASNLEYVKSRASRIQSQLRDEGIRSTKEVQSELEDLIEEGVYTAAKDIGLSRREVREVLRVIGASDINRLKMYLRRAHPMIGGQILRFEDSLTEVADELVEAAEEQDTRVVDQQVYRAALSSLCPLWPIC